MSTFVAALSQNVRLRPRKNGRYAVLLITPPPDWRPTAPCSLPQEVVSARFLIRQCRAAEACAVAQAFNLAHWGRHSGGEWAVVVSSLFGVVPANE